jgi:hypothetical protein
MPPSRPELKLAFADFWEDFDPRNNFFYRLLAKRFDIQLSDRPDFLIYSWSGFGERHLEYDCTRIYYGGEHEWPDYTACDASFSFHYMDDPRHYRLPLYVLYFDLQELIKRDQDPAAVLAGKSRFCNFVYSNPRCLRRNRFFSKLTKYKKVDSGGRFLNNVGGPVKDKIAFMRDYKFTIAFENHSEPGYTTEKLAEPMRVGSLPIYWGNPRVGEDFNTRSFLSYHDYGSDEALIERIIELDRNDDLYLEYVRQPWLHGNRVPAALNDEALLARFEEIFGAKDDAPVAVRRKSYRLLDATRRRLTRDLVARVRLAIGDVLAKAVELSARRTTG